MKRFLLLLVFLMPFNQCDVIKREVSKREAIQLCDVDRPRTMATPLP